MPDQDDALKPFGPRVLVEDPPAEMESGIILPDSAQPLGKGIVVEIGQPLTDFGMPDLHPGDLIYFKKGCGEEVDGQRVIGMECIIAFRRTALTKLPAF